MTNIKKYTITPCVEIDTDTDEVVVGHYVELLKETGLKSSRFFVPGKASAAVAHIKRINNIVDIVRLEKLHKMFEEVDKAIEAADADRGDYII